MVFIFAFLPAVIVLYYVIPNRVWKNTLLCIVSLFFYAWGEPLYILLMLASVILNYGAGLLIQEAGPGHHTHPVDKRERQKDKVRQRRARFILVWAVILNLTGLVVFKYTDFFIENINSLLHVSVPKMNLPLPIGISFYTFQALSYIIDVYRGRIIPQKNPVYLAMYIAFFPQLIAGPIVRYTDISQEIDGRKETLEGFTEGVKTFIKGLAAKVILANNLAVFADSVYADFSDAGSLVLWIAAACYMLQIYFDFAGYSTMAIGLGRMFGFHFPQNFNRPYTAVSVTDFWRRWHITLSSWFRDYVYIPLGGNRCSVRRHCFNILVTWLLTGFWHGAEWNFILWGVYYALFLLLEKYVFARFMEKNSWTKLAYKAFTLFVVLLGWVLFRLEDMSSLLSVLGTMFSFQSTDVSIYVISHAATCSKLVFFIPAVLAASSVSSKAGSIIKKRLPAGMTAILQNAALIILFAVSVAFLLASSYNPFIYFRF